MPGAPGAASWLMLCTGARAALTRWLPRPRPPLGQALGWPIMSPTGWGPSSAAVGRHPSGRSLGRRPSGRGTLGPASAWVSAPRVRGVVRYGSWRRSADRGTFGPASVWDLAPWVRGVHSWASGWVVTGPACAVGQLLRGTSPGASWTVHDFATVCCGSAFAGDRLLRLILWDGILGLMVGEPAFRPGRVFVFFCFGLWLG